MQIHRRLIDPYGRISIPVSIREELKIEPNDRMEICANDNGEIIISKIEHRCIICGRPTERVYKGQFVCKQCVAEQLNGYSEDSGHSLS